MKKITFYASVLMTFFLGSCQKETLTEDVNANFQRVDWLSADLNASFAASQQKVTAYLFEKKALADVINAKEVDHVRFVLGFDSNIIKITAVGIDAEGKELVSASSKVLFENQYDQQLVKLKETKTQAITAKTQAITAKTVVSKHVLAPKMAYSGIKGWQEKLAKVKDLNEVSSYNGERINYYSLEKEVVQAMIENANTASVGLFLGLNVEEKLTTVFVGLNKENSIRSSSPTAKDAADEVYDFSRPCPSVCDIPPKKKNE
jgi:hypothetical protein